MTTRYSLLFRFSFSSNISMLLAVNGSIVILFFNVSFINIPTPPPSLSSLIFPTHLHPFTTMFSFCLRFVSVTANRSDSVAYTISFNDFIFDLNLLYYCIKFSACSLQFFYSLIFLFFFFFVSDF